MLTHRRRKSAAKFLAIALIAASEPGLAKGAGLWRLPSSLPQYCGYGSGPGRHAPIIRSPGYRPPRAPRLNYIPAREHPFCACEYTSLTTGGCNWNGAHVDMSWANSPGGCQGGDSAVAPMRPTVAVPRSAPILAPTPTAPDAPVGDSLFAPRSTAPLEIKPNDAPEQEQDEDADQADDDDARAVFEPAEQPAFSLFSAPR